MRDKKPTTATILPTLSNSPVECTLQYSWLGNREYWEPQQRWGNRPLTLYPYSFRCQIAQWNWSLNNIWKNKKKSSLNQDVVCPGWNSHNLDSKYTAGKTEYLKCMAGKREYLKYIWNIRPVPQIRKLWMPWSPSCDQGWRQIGIIWTEMAPWAGQHCTFRNQIIPFSVHH